MYQHIHLIHNVCGRRYPVFTLITALKEKQLVLTSKRTKHVNNTVMLLCPLYSDTMLFKTRQAYKDIS